MDTQQQALLARTTLQGQTRWSGTLPINSNNENQDPRPAPQGHPSLQAGKGDGRLQHFYIQFLRRGRSWHRYGPP